jgi:hypothetical protein
MAILEGNFTPALSLYSENVATTSASPRTESGRLVSIVVSRFCESNVPTILYLPMVVNDTTGAASLPDSIASLAASPAFTKPCGVSQIMSCRCSAAAACGVGPFGPTFHALSPFTTVFCCWPPNVGWAKPRSTFADFWS